MRSNLSHVKPMSGISFVEMRHCPLNCLEPPAVDSDGTDNSNFFPPLVSSRALDGFDARGHSHSVGRP